MSKASDSEPPTNKTSPMKKFLDRFVPKKMSLAKAQGWMNAAAVFAVISMLVTARSAFTQDSYLFVDVAILAILAAGVYMRNFPSAVILFLYFLFSKVFQVYTYASAGIVLEDGAMVTAVIFALVFSGVFFMGVLGGLRCRKSVPKKKAPMKRSVKLLFMTGVVLVVVGAGLLFFGVFNGGNSSSIKLTNGIKASVVNVLCPYGDLEFSLDSDGTGGSGVVMDPEGFVLTNNHIIPQDDVEYLASDDGCFVVFPNVQTGLPEDIYLAHPYVVSGWGELYDLAYLEIYDVYTDEEGVTHGSYPREFPYLEDIRECFLEDLNLGDPVVILGYPSLSGGMNLTVTEGIISSFSEFGEIITSAQLTPGYSGGLALTKDNCYIGVPSAYYSEEVGVLGGIVSVDLIYEFADYAAGVEFTDEALDEWMEE